MRSHSWLAVCLALSACSSGQTGSPDCAASESCVCNPLYGAGTLLRVHAESVESGRLVAVVDEVFSAPEVAVFVQPGDRIGGAVGAEKPCARDDASGLLAGAEFFVLYSPGGHGGYPNCDAFQRCAAEECMGLPEPELTTCWERCETETAEFCDVQRTAALLDGYFAWAIPWGQSLDLGGDKRLPSSDIPVLYDIDACFERFPAPEAPPCNDTRTVTQCTVTSGAASSPRSSSWPLLLALAAVIVALAARRGRRSWTATRLW